MLHLVISLFLLKPRTFSLVNQFLSLIGLIAFKFLSHLNLNFPFLFYKIKLKIKKNKQLNNLLILKLHSHLKIINQKYFTNGSLIRKNKI